MTNYGIKLVSAGWQNDATVGFSDRGYSRFKDQVPPGTKMLLYETATPVNGVKGTKAIVGAVQVTGTTEDGAKQRTPTEQHDQIVPVNILIPRDNGKLVPLERIREIIGDPGWPRLGEAWKTISKDQYEAILRARGD